MCEEQRATAELRTYLRAWEEGREEGWRELLAQVLIEWDAATGAISYRSFERGRGRELVPEEAADLPYRLCGYSWSRAVPWEVEE
jgi:hypothetical protein